MQAPAGSQRRPPIARLARFNSGTTPSGPFKRPVKQRLSPFGRGPQAAVPREGEFRTAQVAPPREAEVRSSQVAPPREGEPGRRPDRPASVPYSAEMSQRRHFSNGAHREISKERENAMKRKTAAQTTSVHEAEKTMKTSYPDAFSMLLSEGQTGSLDKLSSNSGTDNIKGSRKSLPSFRRKPNTADSADGIPHPLSKALQQRGDANRNYLYTKSRAHVEGEKINQFVSHSDIGRPSPGQSIKRDNASLLEERAQKKPRHIESAWNSPDQSFSWQSTTATECFQETSQQKAMNNWSMGKSSRAYQRSSYAESQSFGHRRRNDMSFNRRTGAGPPAYRMQRSTHGTHGQYERFRTHNSHSHCQPSRRRPPLLPTPPSRFYSGGSPAVTTTTCLGETPPTVPHSGPPVVPPGPHHWAAGMPLLPQFLEPLSPMSPLSVSSPPSPALPVSPPASPSLPSPHLSVNSGRDSPPRPQSPQPPVPYSSDRSRPPAGLRRPTSYTDRPRRLRLRL